MPDNNIVSIVDKVLNKYREIEDSNHAYRTEDLRQELKSAIDQDLTYYSDVCGETDTKMNLEDIRKRLIGETGQFKENC